MRLHRSLAQCVAGFLPLLGSVQACSGGCCVCCHAEYSSTLHQVLVGLESSVLPLWQLGGLLLGYLGLLLFTVYLASSEVRLPIVQYSKVPPPVGQGF